MHLLLLLLVLVLAMLLPRSRLVTTQGAGVQLAAAMQLLPAMPAHMVLQLGVLGVLLFLPRPTLQLQRLLRQLHCLQL
jgi:hypothetical protein